MGSVQCNHINGTCMNGCDSGFEGLNCTKGKFIVLKKLCYTDLSSCF